MVSIYLRMKEECGYNATRFLQMINDIGGVEAARTLLRKGRPSEGFAALWECGRLDLTVEAHLLQPKFQTLFTAEERKRAREILEAHGFDFELIESQSI